MAPMKVYSGPSLFLLQGALESGQVFDSSRAEGREPVSIKLGAGQVIRGMYYMHIYLLSASTFLVL